MCGIKIPQQEFTLKMQMEGGGAYLWDTTVLKLGVVLCVSLTANDSP